MNKEAFLAGAWASMGSTLAKLSGTTEIVGEGYSIWAGLLILMVLSNTWSCRYYLRSLDASSNTVTPTVVSSAINYMFSGIVGIFILGEGASLSWWCGATLITIGLALIAKPEKKHAD